MWDDYYDVGDVADAASARDAAVVAATVDDGDTIYHTT